MNNLFTKVAAMATATVALSVIFSQQAQAISFNFEWQGDGGYSIRGMFGYDENTAPAIISESGLGATSALQFLMVDFFDPSNNLLQSNNTVVNGVSNSNFFAFEFDTTTQQIINNINIGGGTGVTGEYFFSGTVGGLLRFRQLTGPGTSINVDTQDPGTITVTEKVPEPASILGLATLGLLGVVSRRRTIP